MEKEQYMRFKDAPWIIKQSENIILGGAGGISSWTALFLSRVNVDNKLKIHVFDYDKIEEHNYGGQFFKFAQRGFYKTVALQQNITDFCNGELILHDKYDEKSLVSHIMIAGFDNMKARKIMFDNWENEICNYTLYKDNTSIEPIFIDGRLAAEQLQIYCVTPNNIKEYKSKLFTDKEADNTPCTFKQTSHVAAMIGSLITTFLLNHINNSYINKNLIEGVGALRIVPFYSDYYTPFNILTN